MGRYATVRERLRRDTEAELGAGEPPDGLAGGAPHVLAGGAPHVLIVGGFLTEPFNYWPMRRRLLERGTAGVSIAPLHLPDWLAAGLVGFGPMLAKLGGAIRRAEAESGGRPLLVVAHSGGGIVTRLTMSEVAFRGRRGAVAPSIGALVTLGTPHGLARCGVRAAHSGIVAARFLDRHCPGCFFAPTTAYLTVGSDFVRPDRLVQGTAAHGRRTSHGHRRTPNSRWRRIRPLTWWDRLLTSAFDGIVGPLPPEGGDGIVPAAAAHLPGAEQLTFHDVRHGHIGGPWYGDDEIIDRWWPRAVDLWHGALAARESALDRSRQVL